jgi:hypothetical protein
MYSCIGGLVTDFYSQSIGLSLNPDKTEHKLFSDKDWTPSYLFPLPTAPQVESLANKGRKARDL